jgi:hypothetical protein
MTFQRIFPAKLYEGLGGEKCTVRTAVFNLTAGSTTAVIPANPTKKIRVMGTFGTSDSGSAMGVVYFRNGTGGANLLDPVVYPLNTQPTTLILPIVDSGYCETDVNTALALQVFVSTVRGTVFFIEYTPD